MLLLFIFSTIHLFLGIYAKSAGESNKEVPGSTALENFPLIDGHNDLAWNLLKFLQDKLDNFHFDSNLTQDPVFVNSSSCHTDLPRLRRGKLGAQFWAAYIDCKNTDNSVSRTLDQIDVIKRLIERYPNDLKYVTTADGILEAFKEKKLASLIGVEGGNSIDNKLSVLRMYYELGVRYLTLTHVCDLDWADSATVDINNSPKRNLTDFGKKIVLEMNRLGMMVDLSHVSHNVMIDAIKVSRAPIIFSHSSAKAVFSHVRNVADDVLKRVKENGGIVMVNFYPKFIAEDANIHNVTEHINHIVDVAGINHVGIGSDFDGIEAVAKGLEDVSKYPDLFDLLKEQNPKRWSIENLEKLAGRNLIRVFKEVEKVKLSLIDEKPREDIFEKELV